MQLFTFVDAMIYNDLSLYQTYSHMIFISFLSNRNTVIAKLCLFLTLADYKQRFAHICNKNTVSVSSKEVVSETK